MDCFHPLTTTVEPPELFTWPFHYKPHRLCLLAAEEVRRYVVQCGQPWVGELAEGKMLGVLVCRNEEGLMGFLAAYSGQLGGREDWPWFVPAVYDYLQPDGYFKQEELAITTLNHRIATLQQNPSWQQAQEEARRLRQQAHEEVEAYQQFMSEARRQRHRLRQQQPDEPAVEARLVRESQHQKAELKRLRRRWQTTIAEAETRLHDMETEVESMKRERHQRSDALQRWLFSQFRMLNAHGQERTLLDIFAATPQQLPPAGAGECCAPKLLQYAYRHHLQPLCMAEFWQGASPQGEVRHHNAYYPACRGKCKPILEHMLMGLAVEPDELAAPIGTQLLQQVETVYADRHLAVIVKPAGLLSVPGKAGLPSVQELMRQQYPEAEGPMMVHRLDMDTSGLLVIALTSWAYQHLQRQFLLHVVKKRYVALLSGVPTKAPAAGCQGTISLPLRPAPLDRPRQVVDEQQGLEATTHYEVLAVEQGQTRIALSPTTGRTHQLRVHCAHHDGLGTPIVGDRLYGHADGERLCLHAEQLQFFHPATGRQLTFMSGVPF